MDNNNNDLFTCRFFVFSPRFLNILPSKVLQKYIVYHYWEERENVHTID